MMEKIESGQDNVNFALVVHWNVLKEAVLATSEKRGSTEEITEYKEIVDEMRESQLLK